jgi:hypothetical protein
MTMTKSRNLMVRRPWHQVAEELSLDPTNPALVWDAVLHQLSEHLWGGPNIVYLMSARGRVKVGRTNLDVERRAKAISRAINHPVFVMAYIHASPDLERSLHAIFGPWCCVGGHGSADDMLTDVKPWTKEWFTHIGLFSRLACVMNAIEPHGGILWSPTDQDRQEAGFVQRLRP